MTRSSVVLAILLHAAGIGAAYAVGGAPAGTVKPDAGWVAVELACDVTPVATELPPEPQTPEVEPPVVPLVEVAPELATPFDAPPMPVGPLPRDGRVARFLPSTVRVVPPALEPTATSPVISSVLSPAEVAAEPRAPAAVDVDPSPLQAVNQPPVYPFTDWRRGHQGTVVLDLDIDVRGKVLGARIVTSSGWRGLDLAAREQLLTWRFEPARRDGRACATVFRQSVEFRIVPEGATPSVGFVGGGALH